MRLISSERSDLPLYRKRHTLFRLRTSRHVSEVARVGVSRLKVLQKEVIEPHLLPFLMVLPLELQHYIDSKIKLTPVKCCKSGFARNTEARALRGI